MLLQFVNVCTVLVYIIYTSIDLKIQWGIYQKANGATISYPLSFDSIPIVIAHLTEYVTTHSVIGDVSKTSFKTKASQYSTAGEQRNGNYIALGY